MIGALAQADLTQQLQRPLAALGLANAGAQQRDLDVGLRREHRQQVVQLEDEADDLAPEARGVVQVGHRDAVDHHGPGVGAIQPSDQREERALARPRRAGDEQHLAGVDLERDVVERVDAPVEGARDVLDPHLGAADPSAGAGRTAVGSGDRRRLQRRTLTA